jgi:hypothetical protein
MRSVESLMKQVVSGSWKSKIIVKKAARESGQPFTS